MLILANLPGSATESADAVKVHFPLWPDRSRPWEPLARSLGQDGSVAATPLSFPVVVADSAYSPSQFSLSGMANGRAVHL